MKNRSYATGAASFLVLCGVAGGALAQEASERHGLAPCRAPAGCQHFQGYVYVHRAAPKAPSVAFFDRVFGAPERDERVFVHLGEASEPQASDSQ